MQVVARGLRHQEKGVGTREGGVRAAIRVVVQQRLQKVAEQRIVHIRQVDLKPVRSHSPRISTHASQKHHHKYNHEHNHTDNHAHTAITTAAAKATASQPKPQPQP